MTIAGFPLYRPNAENLRKRAQVCPKRFTLILRSPDSDHYISQIKALLDARACVKCDFSVPDQKFAETLFARNVSLEQIERAIALGCARKYVSLLNGADSGAIVSFAYFGSLIEEAGDEDTPADYWDYVKPRSKKLEEQWTTR